jgi:spoIIIJ-associated protein
MTFREFSGKNVEEAIRAAMKEFGADLSDLDIEILAQGSRGILGVGGEEARILAAPKSAIQEELSAAPPAPAAAPAPSRRRTASKPPAAETTTEEVEPEDIEAVAAGEAEAALATGPVGIGDAAADEQAAELARADAMRRRRGGRGRGGRGRDERNGGRGREYGERAVREPRPDRPAREPAPFVPARPLEELSGAERATLEEAKTVLEELLRLMELPATVEIAMGTETSKLNVRGDNLGVLIGRRGEKLASLQHIVNLIASRKEGQHHRIAIDVENYRGRREDQLRDVAERAAKRVSQTGRIIQLEPMPALERRIVHMALLENPKVRTQSVGVEPNRRIVVLPASQVKTQA